MRDASLMVMQRVLGVDACRGGWLGVTLSGGMANAYFALGIEDLIGAVEGDGQLDAVAVDMPIGLPDAGQREADRLAKAEVGRLGSSVFVTPTRAAFAAPDHASAVTINREHGGAGISFQAFSLKAKLLQVDHWVRRTPLHVVEVHPEVSFARLAGEALTVRKSTWAGAHRRRALLAGVGVRLDTDLGVAGAVAGVDDVLDAAIAAWSAQRVARGEAMSMPNPPERFSDGLASAIWV